MGYFKKKKKYRGINSYTGGMKVKTQKSIPRFGI